MFKHVFIGVGLGLFLALQFSLFLISFSPDIALLLDTNSIAFLKDVVGPVSSGFGGAIAGAYAAFWFQGHNERNKEAREGYRALSMTKLDYLRRIQYLVAIKKNSIERFKAHEFRFLAIQTLPDTPRVAGVIGLEIIDYLLAEKAKTAVDMVLNANHNYQALFENIKGRNGTYLSYRDILNSSRLGHDLVVDFPAIVSVIEPARLISVYNTTENVLTNFDFVIQYLHDAMIEIGKVLDGPFKAKGFPVIDFGVVEEGGLERLPPPVHDLESLKKLIIEVKATEVHLSS
ncbi:MULTISPECIES: hypothetical protein [unclassified Pseudomonas]|uniref:hypothetical protein n=1 Tax=unclassified Pseudomonas TaxID=196821 RepID=UPI00117B6549|nr:MULTISPECIES: hypothetical protein [unclassified Pseudomonas]